MDRGEQYFEKQYYSPKSLGSFGGLKRLYSVIKKENPNITIKEVQEWLENQEVYSLFKQVKKRFPRLPILVNKIDEQWQIDLMDMTWLTKENDGFRYLFNIIDCFSRFAWVIPIKTKKSDEIVEKIESVFKSGRVPDKLQSDQGREFKNTHFMRLMEKYRVKFFTSTDDVIKCAIVERFNRTLRSRIYRYMTYKSSKRYIDVIDDIVDSYNKSFHRTIGMAPSEVKYENMSSVLVNIRKSHPQVRVGYSPFKVGSKVRISRAKGTFEKGSTSNFTQEIFTVRKVKKTPQGYVYRLKDWSGEEITSIFYQNELVHAVEPSLYKIEKILKTRVDKRTGVKEYFVKWLGYPNKFNSWIENVESAR